MDDFVLREPRVLAHSSDIRWSIVFVGWSPSIDEFTDGVARSASAIETVDVVFNQLDACPQAHLHRLKLFEHLIFLDWPLTLPVAPLNDVQGVVIPNSSWFTHRLGKYCVNIIESSGYV